MELLVGAVMDLDFDLDDDKIKSFLQNKLREIKSKNKKLEDTLSERRKFLRDLTEGCNMQMDENDVKIASKVWKKIFNNKYTIGVPIVNEGSTCLRDIKILLSRDSTYPLAYQVNIYDDNKNLSTKKSTMVCSEESCDSITDSLKKSDKINQLGQLIISLNQPKFIDKISYIISGNIIFQQNEREVTLEFPSVEISSMDAVNNELSDFLPSKGDVNDILTIISAMEHTDLVMIFPREWSSSFDSTFEILCSLRKVDIPSSCKQFYVAYKLSPSLDDSLVAIHVPRDADTKVSYVSIYARNEGCLFSLLHHFHRNIPGVVIIPKMLHENYVLQHPDHISEARLDIEKFSECANTEIKFVKNFQQKCQSIQALDTSDVVKFRSDLADLEKNTDLCYQRIYQRSNKL